MNTRTNVKRKITLLYSLSLDFLSSAGRCTVDGRMKQGILRFSYLGSLEKLKRDNNTNQDT